MMNMKKWVLALTSSVVLLSQSAFALDIQTWKTSNGVEVLFVESHDLPMIDVRLAFKAGSSRDGDLYGISRLVNALIVEGTGDYSSEDVAENFESVGAELGHDSLRDMAFVSLRSLSDKQAWEKVVDLFARVSALPSFPLDAIERDRKSMLISLANREKEIGDVAEDTFYKNLYKNHVYKVGRAGTKQTMQAITQKNLSDFHSKYYVANNATLALMGDLTLDQAKQYAEQITQYLKAGQKASPIEAVKMAEQGGTIKVPFKTSQTHIIQGLPVMKRGDDDYYALYLGNHILGGSGFSSRLMQEIRENRGLSYSVYSYFLPMESNGPFQMALQTKNHQVDEASQLLNQMLVDFIKDGPTDAEIDHSKKNITGSFPLKIDSNNKIVEYLSLIGFYDLPLDYLDSFNANILKVTSEDIKDAFSRRVKPEQLIRVIVGEAS
ncbi:MAG: insulinase family protein [Gammaproteobacteria bacterium]|jgi:zinc protease|nr:insulinase family protein [Gammaproteobacteria bacterium]MBT4078624.1 insulinase family protein [Gammaproteobacteria bacterium]MBT4195834.1 insulinase family protein [Gammaproteobacteria bacterium]MBT4448942.1 insulinase family protein [Gammaproteobacteria bacterium]MBT4861604.1 insulinase family protein [Gammaproteobacteria bacterium]